MRAGCAMSAQETASPCGEAVVVSVYIKNIIFNYIKYIEIIEEA